VASIARLRDIGVEPYLIASSVTLFVAQRLVRMVCPNCRTVYTPDPKLLHKFRAQLRAANVKKFYKGAGCDQCNLSGFYGRTSILEIFKVDEKIKNLIFNRAPESVLLKEAIHNGMSTLLESGIRKVAAGTTTLDEVVKAADIHDEPGPVASTLEVIRKMVPHHHPAPQHKKERDTDPSISF
jgi:type IV pilus assembly protein PilB